MIESLNERVKHLAIILKDLSEILKPVNTSVKMFDEETKKQMLNKLNNIQTHSTIVSKWINDTNLDETYLSKKLNNT